MSCLVGCAMPPTKSTAPCDIQPCAQPLIYLIIDPNLHLLFGKLKLHALRQLNPLSERFCGQVLWLQDFSQIKKDRPFATSSFQRFYGVDLEFF
jgi:hypothetical protein